MPLVYPVIIKKLKCLFKEQYAFLWGELLLLLLLLLLWCVKVSQLHSLWGRNREVCDPANRGGSENKHWKHGHGQNPARAGAQLPRGHLWDCADPRGHRMEPDITTAVDKCRQCGRRQPGKHLQGRDEGVNFNLRSTEGQLSAILQLITGLFVPSLMVYRRYFGIRECERERESS